MMMYVNLVPLIVVIHVSMFATNEVAFLLAAYVGKVCVVRICKLLQNAVVRYMWRVSNIIVSGRCFEYVMKKLRITFGETII